MTNRGKCGTCVGVDPDTGQPEFRAIKTLEDVLSWQLKYDQPLGQPFSQAASFTRSTKPWTRPLTLVCHDFKGGYLQDRYLQGGQKVDPYYFCRWECIDIFVYFSHYFVTIPPLGWIRAAHKHGVPILGTVITEWEEGAAIWSKVLASKDAAKQLMKQLVSICSHYGFDGWLVNVENKIEPKDVASLREFIEILTEECHHQLPGSKVLWYDSVTREGELKWQNEVNVENSIFFYACDGIFLNYCWTPEKLAASKCVAEEKGRPFDVFVGIDAFGRGCPGGGGFNTVEALQHAWDKNLSAAIFAPAWTLQVLGLEHFDENDCNFWSKICDLCPLTSGGGLPLATAFCQGHGDSFFCLGKSMTSRPWYNMSMQQRQPERTRVYGFNDPRSQQTQASLNTCLSSAYFGGCSIHLSAHLTQALQAVTFRLFSLTAELDQTLYCSYTYRVTGNTSCDIFLVLTFGAGMLTHKVVMGPGDRHTISACKNGFFDAEGEGHGSPPKKSEKQEQDVFISPLSERDLEPLRSSLWFHDLQDTGRGSQDGRGWMTRHFRLDASLVALSESGHGEESILVAASLVYAMETPPPAERVREKEGGEHVSQEQEEETPPPAERVREKEGGAHVSQEQEEASVLLGHLQIFREKDLHIKAPQIVNISLEKFDPLAISHLSDSSSDSTTKPASYLLQWDVLDGDTPIDYFNIYLGEGDSISLVGHAAATTFVLAISPKFVADDQVMVTIQPILTATSLPQVLQKCSSKTVSLSTVS